MLKYLSKKSIFTDHIGAKGIHIHLTIIWVSIMLIISIALIIAVTALNDSSRQTQKVLFAALTLQINSMGETYTSSSEQDMAAVFIGNPLINELGRGETITYDESCKQAETILESYNSFNYRNETKWYFYFQKSDYLMSSDYPGQNANPWADAYLLEDFSHLDPNDVGYAQKRLGIDKNGDYYDVYIMTVAPYTYSLRTRMGRPSYTLSEAFLNGLTDVEMYTYDRLGNVHTLEENQALKEAFDYDQLGDTDSDTFFFKYQKHYYIGAYYTFTSRHTRLAIFIQDTAAEARDLILRFLLSAAVVALICIGVAALFIHLTYHRLALLRSKLPKGLNQGGYRLHDDYKAINQTLDLWQSQLRHQSELLHNSWLRDLLRGFSAEQISDFYDDWLIEREGLPLSVIAIGFREAKGNPPQDKAALVQMVSMNLEKAGYNFRHLWDGDYLLVIIQIVDGGSTRLVADLRCFMKQFPDESVSISISDVHSSLRELSISYDEAMITSEFHRTINTGDTILCYNTIANIVKKGDINSPHSAQFKMLHDYTVMLSKNDALQQYDVLVYQLITQNDKPLDCGNISFLFLVYTIALAFFDIQWPGDISRETIRHHADKIRSAQNAQELRDFFIESMRSFSNLIATPDNDKNRFNQIKEYIRMNYRDPNLSASAVADQFHISQSSITRLFKKYNNTVFLEYIHQLRVAEAIVLLKETSLPEMEIASLVGYNNVVTMIRAFKTYAFITPSAIRIKKYGSE